MQIPKPPTIRELRATFGSLRWNKFVAAVDAGDSMDILAKILYRKSIATYCRNIYLAGKRSRKGEK